MAFAAEIGRIPPQAWWLLLINTLWAVIYDTFYAMVDREDDLAVGIKSTAILFGRHDLLVLRILMLLMLAALVWLGLALGLMDGPGSWPWRWWRRCSPSSLTWCVRVSRRPVSAPS